MPARAFPVRSRHEALLPFPARPELRAAGRIFLQRAVPGIHEYQAKDRPAVEDGHHIRIGVQTLKEVAGNALGVIVVTRFQTADAGADIRHRDEAQRVELCLARAGITVRRARRRHVAFEAYKLDMAVGFPFAESVGTGADVAGGGDRLLAGSLDDGGGIDRRTTIDEGENILPGSEGGGQSDGDLMLAGGLDAFHVAEQQAASGAVLAPSPQRSHDVGRCHFLAVVEGHVVAQSDGDRPPVFADGFPCGQQRRRRIRGIECVEAFEHVMRDGGRQVGGQHVLVETRRFADGRVSKRAFRPGRRPNRCEGCGGQENPAPSLEFCVDVFHLAVRHLNCPPRKLWAADDA